MKNITISAKFLSIGWSISRSLIDRVIRKICKIGSVISDQPFIIDLPIKICYNNTAQQKLSRLDILECQNQKLVFLFLIPKCPNKSKGNYYHSWTVAHVYCRILSKRLMLVSAEVEASRGSYGLKVRVPIRVRVYVAVGCCVSAVLRGQPVYNVPATDLRLKIDCRPLSVHPLPGAGVLFWFFVSNC